MTTMLLPAVMTNDATIFIAPSLPIRVDQAGMPTPRGHRGAPPKLSGGGLVYRATRVFEDDDRAMLGLWG